MFGQPLESLEVDRERGIPIILDVLTTYMVKYGLLVPGIFRISCNYEKRNKLREAFERDPYVAVCTSDIAMKCMCIVVKYVCGDV